MTGSQSGFRSHAPTSVVTSGSFFGEGLGNLQDDSPRTFQWVVWLLLARDISGHHLFPMRMLTRIPVTITSPVRFM